jgi:hypothetical protein
MLPSGVLHNWNPFCRVFLLWLAITIEPFVHVRVECVLRLFEIAYIHEQRINITFCFELGKMFTEAYEWWKTNTAVLPQPPYSPGLVPADFFLFPKLKPTLNGRRFQTIQEITENSQTELRAIRNNGLPGLFPGVITMLGAVHQCRRGVLWRRWGSLSCRHVRNSYKNNSETFWTDHVCNIVLWCMNDFVCSIKNSRGFEINQLYDCFVPVNEKIIFRRKWSKPQKYGGFPIARGIGTRVCRNDIDPINTLCCQSLHFIF